MICVLFTAIVCLLAWEQRCHGFTCRQSQGSNAARLRIVPHSMVGSTEDGSYFSEPGSSYMLRDFASYEDMQNIVALAAKPLPERPDGIVTVVKFTSANRPDCQATEAEYERLARANPATIFMRTFEEYEQAELLFGKAEIQYWPTYDIFYKGDRVARIEGPDMQELQKTLDMYQFLKSNLDLFSEEAMWDRETQWGDKQAMATPRTTARFIPGYDWASDKGFFDNQAEKAQRSFEDDYENSWIPSLDDD